MEVKHKNLKEDIKLLVSLGESYSGERFELRFFSGKFGVKEFVCSFDGGSAYTNCEMADDKHVLCLLDNHGLPCGLVGVEISVFLNDTQMEDKNYKLHTRKLVEFMLNRIPYHLELTNGASDDIHTEEVVLDLIGNVIKGDPFTYDDFTEEQIAVLKQPAVEAAALARTAASAANTAKNNADAATAEANEAKTFANAAAEKANASAGVVESLLGDLYGESGVLSTGNLYMDFTTLELSSSKEELSIETNSPLALNSGDSLTIENTDGTTINLYEVESYENGKIATMLPSYKRVDYNTNFSYVEYKNTKVHSIVVFSTSEEDVPNGTYKIIKSKNIVEQAQEIIDTFESNESQRQATFEASEDGRNTSFQNKEAERDRAEASRQTSFEQSEAGRATTFAQSEASRTATFEQSEESRNATFESKEAERDAANEAATNAAAQLSELALKVDNNADVMLNGGSIVLGKVTEFSAGACLTLTNTIALSAVGDYVEIKAKIGGKGILLASNYASNNPVIKYQYYNSSTDKVQLYVWMDGATTAKSSKALSNPIDINNEHIVKVLLSAKSGDVCTYECYLDGVKFSAATGSINPITDGVATTFYNIGVVSTSANAYDYASTITYIKYKSGGSSEVMLTGFSTKGTVTSGSVIEKSGDAKTYYSTSELKDDIDDLEDSIDAIDDKVNDIVTETSVASKIDYTKDSTATISENGYLNGNATTYTSTTQYYSRGFVMRENGSMYVKTIGSTYLQINVYSGSTLSTATFIERVRNTSSDLPTAESPMSLNKGQLIVVGAANANTTWDIEFDYNDKKKTLSSGISVSASQVDGLNAKNPCFRYVNGNSGCSSTDKVTEFVEVLIPSKKGYIKIPIVHSQDSTINSNVWRIGMCASLDESKALLNNLTVGGGEFECALKLNGRTDFAGGIAHGDEVFSSISFLADGKTITDISAISAYTDFEELRCYEVSSLYDPNDSTTIFATHTSEHIWTKDGLVINQSVQWLVEETLAESYLAMFPIRQEVSEKYLTDVDYSPTTIPSGGLSNKVIAKCNKVVMLSSDMLSSFEVKRYPDIIPTDLLITNNGSTAYNKCYFYCTKAGQGKVASVGDVWKATTEFKFKVGE